MLLIATGWLVCLAIVTELLARAPLFDDTECRPDLSEVEHRLSAYRSGYPDRRRMHGPNGEPI